MSEHNGPAIAAVYQLLTEVARIVTRHDRRFDEHTGKLNEFITTANDHTRKLADIVNRHDRKLDDLGASVADLRLEPTGS